MPIVVKNWSTAADNSDMVTLRLRPYALLIVLLLAGLAVPFLARERTEWDYVFVATAGHLLAGQDIYDRAAGTGFTYPPFQALFGLPVLGLPTPGQRAAWFAVNAICLVYVLRTAWRLAGGGPLRLGRDYPEHFACWLGLIVGLSYLLNALAHQQTDVVLAALVFAGIDRLTRDQSLRAATFFGLAAAMKCTPLLFAPYLLVRGRVLSAAAVFAVFLGANLLPDLVARPVAGGTWLGRWSAEYLEPMARPDYAPGTWASDILFNQSLVGLTNRWSTTTCETAGGTVAVSSIPPAVGPGEMRRWVLAAAAACGGLALAGIVVARRRAAGPAATVWECSAVLAGMLLFSPMSSPAHFGLLLLPGFALARAAVDRRPAWAWPCLGVALTGALLTNKDLWGDAIYTAGLWHGSATAAALACLFACVAALMFTPATPVPTSVTVVGRVGRPRVRVPVPSPA